MKVDLQPESDMLRTGWLVSKQHGPDNAEAVMVRIGFWGYFKVKS